jgi:hypothetical protein
MDEERLTVGAVIEKLQALPQDLYVYSRVDFFGCSDCGSSGGSGWVKNVVLDEHPLLMGHKGPVVVLE